MTTQSMFSNFAPIFSSGFSYPSSIASPSTSSSSIFGDAISQSIFQLGSGGGFSQPGNSVSLSFPYMGSSFYPPQPPQQDDSSDLLQMMLMMFMFAGNLFGGFRPPPRPYPPYFHEPEPSLIGEETVIFPGAKGGRVWGDPHFVGFNGNKYDVMGKAGSAYNIISDKNLQFNAKFKNWGNNGATVIDEAGLQIGNKNVGFTKIQFSTSGEALINGTKLNKGESKTFLTGLKDQNGKRIPGSVKLDGDNLIINTGEYQIKLARKTSDNGNYLDQDVSITSLGTLSDGVQPHGLLGQTAQTGYDKGNGKGNQGEGAIEGIFTDYEVQDLFNAIFKFTRFGQNPGQAVEFGIGAGKAGNTN